MDYTDRLLAEHASNEAEIEMLKKKALREVAMMAYETYLQELARIGNPYSVRIFMEDGESFRIVPDDQQKAFSVEIGEYSEEPGRESMTETDGEQVIRKVAQKIQRAIADIQRKANIKINVRYTVWNPTRS